MKVAYVSVPRFAVAVERREGPSLRNEALVIGGMPHERGSVYELSPEATEQGVEKGMSLRQAEELCPDAIFLPPREEMYIAAFEEMLIALEPFSPLIEPHGLGGAYLEVSGLERLYGLDERLGQSIVKAIQGATCLPVQVRVSRNKFTARMAALEASTDDVLVIAPGKERRFLRELPVSLLPLKAELQERLYMLGICTMGKFASLPASAVLTQFGREGKGAHLLAQGRDESGVIGRKGRAYQELGHRFEDPVGEMPVLQEVARQLCARLLARLHPRGQVCGRVTVTLEFEGGEVEEEHVEMSEASADGHKIGLAVERLLWSFRYGGRISALKISLKELRQGRGYQLSLFSTRTLRKARIDQAVANLVSKYGPDCFLEARLLDLHAVLPERRFILSKAEGFTLSRIEEDALLRPQASVESIAMRRHHDQALPTRPKYQVHEWR